MKLENDAQHKNLRVFSVSTGEELTAFTQKAQGGWELQYTISESHAIRLVGQEIQVFQPADWSKGVVDKLRLEGIAAIALSPGLNPHVAVFVAGKSVRFTLLGFCAYLYHSVGATCKHQNLQSSVFVHCTNVSKVYLPRRLCPIQVEYNRHASISAHPYGRGYNKQKLLRRDEAVFAQCLRQLRLPRCITEGRAYP